MEKAKPEKKRRIRRRVEQMKKLHGFTGIDDDNDDPFLQSFIADDESTK